MNQLLFHEGFWAQESFLCTCSISLLVFFARTLHKSKAHFIRLSCCYALITLRETACIECNYDTRFWQVCLCNSSYRWLCWIFLFISSHHSEYGNDRGWLWGGQLTTFYICFMVYWVNGHLPDWSSDSWLRCVNAMIGTLCLFWVRLTSVLG